MEKSDNLVLPLFTASVALLPVLVIAVGYGANDWLGWQEPPPPVGLTLVDPRYEAIGRSRALAAFLPFMLVSILLVLNFAREYLTFFGPKLRRRMLVPLGIVLVPAIISAIPQLVGGPQGPEIALANSALARVPPVAGAALSPQAILGVLVAGFAVLLALAATSVTVATVSCLARPDPSLRPSLKRHYENAQRGRLTAWLYGSSLLLVTGLFLIDSCLRWPAAFSRTPELYLAQVNAVMLQNGILYSTTLAAYYVPVAWLMRATPRVEGAARRAADADAEADSTPPTMFSPPQVMKAIVAIMSPAVAALLTQLIEGL
ncbi:MAG TPA: hypothetical protein VJS15_05240 [Allosphingosinicella sp.]|nr:hypothetical protein [Allosphingosinicella sp.]